jgi:hypothetical protein
VNQQDDDGRFDYDDYDYDYDHGPAMNVAQASIPLQRRSSALAGGCEEGEAGEVVARLARAVPHKVFALALPHTWYDEHGCLTLRVALRAGLHSVSEGVDRAGAAAAAEPAAPASALATQLSSLLDSGAGADCALAAPCGHRVKAHAWLLAARSPVLATALTKPEWAAPAAADGSVGVPCVTIADVDAPTLTRFVRYIYTGDASLIASADDDAGRANALTLLRLADEYDVGSLREACERVLGGAALEVGTAAETLAAAARHNAPCLKAAASAFVRRHLGAVAATPGWARLLADAPLLQVELLQAIVGAEASAGLAAAAAGANKRRREADVAVATPDE